MNSSKNSLVWLVSLENNGLSNKVHPNTKKELIGDYAPGDDKFLFPIGIVLEHSGGPHIFQDYGDGFSVGTNLVPKKIFDGVDISHLEGELLTLADASFTDKSQREAFKSLLRQTLWKFNQSQEDKVLAIFKAS